MSLRCDFTSDKTSGYCCVIYNQSIPDEVSAETLKGDHCRKYDENFWTYITCRFLMKFTNDDVRELDIKYSTFTEFPDRIGEVFQFITTLQITNSSLRDISKRNLQQFLMVELLNLSDNKLEYLPGDLFTFNLKLKKIYLINNRIKYIDSRVFDGLHKLSYLNLKNNYNIDSTFEKHNDSQFLKKIKDKIERKCGPSGLAHLHCSKPCCRPEKKSRHNRH